MNGFSVWLAPIAAGITLVAAIGYRHWWLTSVSRDRTPSGFGALLAPLLIGAAWLGETTPELVWSLAVVTAGTAVYWFDDLRELGAWLRVCLCFATGLAIGAIYGQAAGWGWLGAAALVLAAGFVTVATVNIVNFQDGADLNLATLVLLTALMLLIYAWAPREWFPAAIACLGFVVPFALFNIRPRTLYLGDSGSFAFGALLTILGVAFVTRVQMPPPEAALPAALPAVDTLFVTIKRIRIRQKFTTRHYFHLYQRLQRDHRGFAYLVPQIANVVLCLAAARALQAAGMGRVVSVVAASVPMTLLVFGLCHLLFVRGEPGPPSPQEAHA